MLIWQLEDLFNSIDKGNLGNAETAGLSKAMFLGAGTGEFLLMAADLNFKPGQYNLVISIFFVPYVLFAPPVAMLGKRFGPARVLSILMFTFGSMHCSAQQQSTSVASL